MREDNNTICNTQTDDTIPLPPKTLKHLKESDTFPLPKMPLQAVDTQGVIKRPL